MNLKKLYEALNGDYDDVKKRLLSESFVERLTLKFLSEDSFETLSSAMQKGDVETAFRAVHTLKGVAQNLGFTALGRSASALTEALRPYASALTARRGTAPSHIEARHADITVPDKVYNDEGTVSDEAHRLEATASAPITHDSSVLPKSNGSVSVLSKPNESVSDLKKKHDTSALSETKSDVFGLSQSNCDTFDGTVELNQTAELQKINKLYQKVKIDYDLTVSVIKQYSSSI